MGIFVLRLDNAVINGYPDAKLFEEVSLVVNKQGVIKERKLV